MKKLLAILLSLALLVGLMAGCASNSQSEEPETPAQSEEPGDSTEEPADVEEPSENAAPEGTIYLKLKQYSSVLITCKPVCLR